jgi:hypothetical protein
MADFASLVSERLKARPRGALADPIPGKLFPASFLMIQGLPGSFVKD